MYIRTYGTTTAIQVCPAAKMTWKLQPSYSDTKELNLESHYMLKKSLNKERTHWNTLTVKHGSKHI